MFQIFLKSKAVCETCTLLGVVSKEKYSTMPYVCFCDMPTLIEYLVLICWTQLTTVWNQNAFKHIVYFKKPISCVHSSRNVLHSVDTMKVVVNVHELFVDVGQDYLGVIWGRILQQWLVRAIMTQKSSRSSYFIASCPSGVRSIIRTRWHPSPRTCISLPKAA